LKRTTSARELLLSIVRGRGPTLRAQLECELRAAIQTGRLPGRTPVPSTRALAADLGVSRGVIVLAYEQLMAEGYLTAARGSATRVVMRRPRPSSPEQAAAVQPAAAPRYDFRPGLPDVSLFPRRAWLSSLRRVLDVAAADALGYPDPHGALGARAALAAYLNRTRGTVARAERMVLCGGYAQGLRLVCEALRSRGVRRVAVEDPGHGGQRADIRAMGLGVQPVPVDGGGLCVERLHRLDVGAVLVTPAHQFPTGVVLAPERRSALLDWAARRRAIVIEDDYDAEYRFDREPVGALQGLADGAVAYLGSASKTLAPALRIGWLLLPPALVDRVALAKLHADHGSPTLDQLAFGDFLERDGLDRHLRKARPVYRRRRDALIAALKTRLPALRVEGVAAGLHLMVGLPPGTDEDTLAEAAAARSLRIHPVGPHRSRPGPPALLLGYASLSEADIEAGVALLATVLGTMGAPRSTTRSRLTRIWDPAERLLAARLAAAPGSTEPR
jgi:GntR family transcriptional regulator / MocR family aminotransferase